LLSVSKFSNNDGDKSGGLEPALLHRFVGGDQMIPPPAPCRHHRSDNGRRAAARSDIEKPAYPVR
jgi:hypothetical protein